MSDAWLRVTPENCAAILAESKEDCLQQALFEARRNLDSIEGLTDAERTRHLEHILEFIAAKIDQHHERVAYRVNGGEIH